MISASVIMRTIIEVPKAVLDRLTEIGERDDISRADVIRRALASYLEQHPPTDEDHAFGLWKKRPRDGIAYEDELRDDWRP
jgi:metal-responsive CopG/Arc/MetJ family transcriptional regulator